MAKISNEAFFNFEHLKSNFVVLKTFNPGSPEHLYLRRHSTKVPL